MTADVKAELLELSRTAWRRLRGRIDGLGDAEYLWEPAPGCWTIRPGADGRHWPDFGVLPPAPAPLTTIAWRLWHVTDILAQERNATWLGLERLDPDDLTAEPTAALAIARLERAYATWEQCLGAVEDEALREPVGSVGGRWATSTRVGFVLHELDELIHHGAEIALLRDLYRAQHATDDEDPLVLALLRADRATIERARSDDPDAIDRVRREHPALVARAAASGRWDAVRLLVDLGFDAKAKHRRTALHDAAGVGDLAMIRLLIAAGADPTTRDDDFHATPEQWADFLGRAEVIEYLRDPR